MQSVFTNYLSPYYDSGLLPEVDQTNTSSIYDQLRIAYNQGASVIDTIRMVCSLLTDDEDSYDIYYAIQNSKDLQLWLEWVNKKITIQIGLHNYMTLGVRLRIATSKLNKLVEQGIVSARIASIMHINLCNNLWNEVTLITNEELPF